MITNRLGLPEFVVNALMYSDYDRTHRPPNSISVTELIDSPYIWSLKQQAKSSNLHGDVSDMMWSMLGQIGHEIAGRAGTHVVKELRLFHPVDDWVITGQFDIYDPVTKCLYDNKFTTQWTLIHEPTGKPEWHAQTNIYAYMMEQIGLEVKEIKIIVWIRDMLQHDKLKQDRPDSDIVMLTIPKWTKERTENYIKERLSLFNEKEYKPCSKEERWAKKEIWAVKQIGGKKAINGGLHETEEKAYAYTRNNPGHIVEHRPGEDTRCIRYCEVRNLCSYYKEKYGDN